MGKEVLGNLEIDQNVVGEVKEELEGWKRILDERGNNRSENDGKLFILVNNALNGMEKGDYQGAISYLKDRINANFILLGVPAPESTDKSKTREQREEEWNVKKKEYGHKIYHRIDQIKELGGIFPNETNMINFLKRADITREPRLASQAEIDEAKKISRG